MKHPLNQPGRDSATPLETRSQALEAALTQALEASPQPIIPDDFALRLMSRLPADKLPAPGHPVRVAASWPASLSEPRAGRRAAFAAIAVLLAIFILLAVAIPRSQPVVYLTAWGVFAAEFIALTVWLALCPDTLR